MGLIDRLRKSWNVFRERGEASSDYYTIKTVEVGPGYSYRPDRFRSNYGLANTIIAAIYNRISIDVSNLDIKHCRLDERGRYKEDINSSLNRCLTLEANIDQTHTAFIRDLVESLLQEGVVAVVPIDYDHNPERTDSYKIFSLRVGKITQWYPKHCRINLYNELTGQKEDVFIEKRLVAIIENPLYSVMNQPNSTLKRLIRKLSLLDAIDEISGSGRMDLIVQMPYSIRSKLGQERIEKRQADIEKQLTDSKYGIAYIDATEKVTQLNRPIENNLLKQIQYLTDMVYSQLGMTTEVFNGTADEQVMLNYTNRTIKPIISAITDEFRRKFLSETARTQFQDIKFFTAPFDLVPVNNLAEIADKLTRNEILTSNEMRQIIGFAPADDPKADMLVNSNISMDKDAAAELQEARGGKEVDTEVVEKEKQMRNRPIEDKNDGKGEND